MPLSIQTGKTNKNEDVKKEKKSPASSSKTTKKKKGKKKDVVETKDPVIVTFYGKEIRKMYVDGKWYFAIEDLIATAGRPEPGKKIKYKEDFKDVKAESVKTIRDTDYTDAGGSIKVINEMVASFPGPIHSWIETSSNLPYIAPLPERKVTQEEIDNPDVVAGVGNPSDSR